jgi:hypothetical protein
MRGERGSVELARDPHVSRTRWRRGPGIWAGQSSMQQD